jgi:hypothetical protein
MVCLRPGSGRRPARPIQEKRLPILSLRTVLGLAAVALLTACAAAPDPLQETGWRDRAYTGPGFGRIFVVGLSAQSLKDQRGFENLMVATLRSAGVDAVPGWQFVPTDRTPDQATMRAAIAQAGADAALLVRLGNVQMETDFAYAPGVATEVAPDMYVGWYVPGVVSQDYAAATIYSTLFDVRTAKPVWTWNPATYAPATFEQQAPDFASELVSRLRSNGLLRAP